MRWLREAMGVIAIVLCVLTAAAIAVMLSPVSATIALVATYVAGGAGIATLMAGSFYCGHQFGSWDTQEQNLDVQQGIRDRAIQMESIESTAAVNAQENAASAGLTVERVNNLETTATQQSTIIIQLQEQVTMGTEDRLSTQLHTRRQFRELEKEMRESAKEMREVKNILAENGLFARRGHNSSNSSNDEDHNNGRGRKNNG